MWWHCDISHLWASTQLRAQRLSLQTRPALVSWTRECEPDLVLQHVSWTSPTQQVQHLQGWVQQQVNEHHVPLSAQCCSLPIKFTEHVRQCLCNSMHSSVSNTTTDSCHSFTEVSNKKTPKIRSELQPQFDWSRLHCIGSTVTLAPSVRWYLRISCFITLQLASTMQPGSPAVTHTHTHTHTHRAAQHQETQRRPLFIFSIAAERRSSSWSFLHKHAFKYTSD